MLILIAGFLRLYRLDAFITFLGDQGRDATIIRRILTLEHFPAIGAPSSIGQIYLGPFYYYLIAPFLLIFRYNPLGLAVAVSLFSIIALTTAFIIIKKEMGYKTGLFFLILLTFSFVNIDMSRYSWNPNLLPLFSFFSIYFFYQLTKTNKLIYAILFGSFLSFAIQLHYLAFFLFFPILITVFFHLWQSKKITQFLNFSVSIISFLFFSSPLIIFEKRHDFLNTRNFIKLFTEGGIVPNSSYLSRFLETNQAIINHLFKTNLNTTFALLILLFFILMSAVLILKNQKINLLLKLNFINVLVFILAFSMLNSQRHPHYYGPIYYSLFLCIAFLLSFFVKRNLVRLVLISLFFIFYVYSNAKNYYFISNKGNYQIKKAQSIAQSLGKNIATYPFQVVPLPSGETDGHVRYFLEVNGFRSLEENSTEQPAELFILCFISDCYPILGNPQWQIASFKNAKIDKIWRIEGVKIYKLVHKN